jgi:hypothetical protein
VLDDPCALARAQRKGLDVSSHAGEWGVGAVAVDVSPVPRVRDDFEVNPQGQFLYVQMLTGLPIAEALADLLLDR